MHRYVPIGLLEVLPPKLNDRAPAFRGRDELGIGYDPPLDPLYHFFSFDRHTFAHFACYDSLRLTDPCRNPPGKY